MLTKNQIKKIRKLNTKKGRTLFDKYVVEGVKITNEVIKKKIKFHELYATKDWLNRHIHFRDKNNVFQVNEKELKNISFLKSPNEVLIVLDKINHHNLNLLKNESIILAYDRIRDPGNLGTILRLSDWFGIKNILCSNDSVDVFNPKCIQSSMGSFLNVNVYYVDLISSLKKLKEYQLIGCNIKGEKLNQMEFPKKFILIFGSESNGISSVIYKNLEKIVTIPKFSKSKIDSLNVASASSIILSNIFLK